MTARAITLKSWQSSSGVQARRRFTCHWQIALAGYFALLSTLVPAQAGNFPPRVSIEQLALERIGQGTAHYAGFIPVCDIALYAEPAQHARQLLDPQAAKRLDIVYRLAIPAGKLVGAAEKTLARQHPQQLLTQWRSHIDALHRSYTDVQPGDRHTLSYLPQQGLELDFNGKQVFTLADEDFAAIYFGIWLGEKPLSEPLRLQLVPGAGTKEQSTETPITPR
jgi:hypothetical protein